MFDDPFFYEIYDSFHSTVDKDRYIGIGKAQGVLVVTTCYTERTGKSRLISFRRAPPKEEMIYYGEQKNFQIFQKLQRRSERLTIFRAENPQRSWSQSGLILVTWNSLKAVIRYQTRLNYAIR